MMSRFHHAALKSLAIALLLASFNSIWVHGAETPSVPGADLFKSGTVVRLKVEIAKDQMAALKADARHEAHCTIHEGATVYRDVGVHLKGAAGSFRELNDKPALTLTFNRFNPGQRFHGLRKIHLNNSVQDPSYLTELICGQMFEEAGVPAARAAHARVALNDRDLGFYVVKEGFTRDLLGRYFKDVNGNLYDGGFLKDVADLANDNPENQSTNRGDLKALASAARENDPRIRWERLDRVLDLDRFISFMAVEVLTWHWDGYSMNRNNYRLYHDPTTSKMVFFPHGMDQMFGDSDGALFPEMQGMVADAVIRTPEGRRRYLDRLGTLFTNVFNLQVLTNRVNEHYTSIHPVIASISGQEGRDHAEAVSQLRERIANRYEGIRKQLAAGGQTTLPFSENNSTTLSGWRERDASDHIKLDRATDKDGKPNLHITAADNGAASWRTRVRLESGRYRFEGRVRTRKVKATADNKGEGAGLRISGRDRVNGNKLSGTSDWQTLVFPFEITANDETVELVCELRARAGEAWFDTESLKLIREKP